MLDIQLILSKEKICINLFATMKMTKDTINMFISLFVAMEIGTIGQWLRLKLLIVKIKEKQKHRNIIGLNNWLQH